MRTFLHVAAGVALCLIIDVGIDVFEWMNRPFGAVTNADYPLVQIIAYKEGSSGGPQYELIKGQSEPLPHGSYMVSIPDIKASFIISKDKYTTYSIHSVSGLLLIETDSSANTIASIK
jgi:hypothetical protein